MNNWHELAIGYFKSGLKISEITRKLNGSSIHVTYDAVRSYIRRHKNDISTETKPVVIQNQEPTVHNPKWNGTTVLKFAIIGDTQLGSKYAQISHLNNFYKLCASEGIKDVYHTGDITDGLKMRSGHEYELYKTSADDMVQDVIDNYPKIDGITTHFITGNHDASIYKQVGYDIGNTIAEKRPDMKYL